MSDAETFYRTAISAAANGWSARVIVDAGGSMVLDIEDQKPDAHHCTVPLSPSRVRELRRILAGALIEAHQPIYEPDEP